MWQSIKEYIPSLLRTWWGMTIGGIGAVGTVTQLMGYRLPNVPLWAWLTIMFVGFSIAQFLAFHKVRIQRDELQRQLSKEARVKEIRDKVGAFLEEGQQLQSQCSTYQKEPPPNEQAANWMKRTEEFLYTYLGDSYVVRFRSNAGLSLTRGMASFFSESHRVLWVNIDYRLARLGEFLAEVRPASSI